MFPAGLLYLKGSSELIQASAVCRESAKLCATLRRSFCEMRFRMKTGPEIFLAETFLRCLLPYRKGFRSLGGVRRAGGPRKDMQDRLTKRSASGIWPGATVGSVNLNREPRISLGICARVRSMAGPVPVIPDGAVAPGEIDFALRADGSARVLYGARQGAAKECLLSINWCSRPQAAALQDGESGAAGMSAEARRLHSRVYADAQETELGAAQGGACG